MNALSKGALRDDLELAVTEGREDGSDQHWLSRLVHGDNTFGRTNVNFHVWLESGLRSLLRDDRSPEDLYREIGQAFIDLSAVKDAESADGVVVLTSSSDWQTMEIFPISRLPTRISKRLRLPARSSDKYNPCKEDCLKMRHRLKKPNWPLSFVTSQLASPTVSRPLQHSRSWYRKSHARLKCTLPPSVPIPPRFVLPTFKTHGVRMFYKRQLCLHRVAQLNTYSFAVSHDTRVR